MNALSKLKPAIPFILLIALLGLLWHELFSARAAEIPSALVGEPVPHFRLQTLFAPPNQFTEKNLRGRVSLLNVWATWCYACNLEHGMLMKIKDEYHVPIYGINYKDNPQDARAYLQKKGNPYVMIGSDNSGDTGIDLGIYGTPETFVISPRGRIIYRHVGTIDQETWDSVLYPLLKKYESVR